MGDPEGAAAHVRKSLKDDGTWLMVEPMAGNSLAENLNPVSRLYYAFSTMICVPASKDQEVGLALGAQAGEARICEVVTKGGGFSTFRPGDRDAVQLDPRSTDLDSPQPTSPLPLCRAQDTGRGVFIWKNGLSQEWKSDWQV